MIFSGLPVIRPESLASVTDVGNFSEEDFWPASKSAIKFRIRSDVTQAEAAIAIATSLHR